MQILFMELLENFNFSPDSSQSEIIRAATSIVTPMCALTIQLRVPVEPLYLGSRATRGELVFL